MASIIDWLAPKAHAAVWDVFSGSNTANGTGVAVSLTQIITNIVNVILLVAGALAVIYLIYSGILYITAAGNPDSAKKGQQGVINAIIGIVIIALAYVIVRTAVSLGGGLGSTTGVT